MTQQTNAYIKLENQSKVLGHFIDSSLLSLLCLTHIQITTSL